MILVSYGLYDRDELGSYEPRVVHVDRSNHIVAVDTDVASLNDTIED